MKVALFVAILISSATAHASQITSDDKGLISAGENVAKSLVWTVDLSEPPLDTSCESETDPIIGVAVLAAACCKICKKGKACGDTCISKSKTCHKPKGCACNG